jgi:hypothetical protein
VWRIYSSPDPHGIEQFVNLKKEHNGMKIRAVCIIFFPSPEGKVIKYIL